MLLLIVLLGWSWFVIIIKSVQIYSLKRQANAFEQRFWSIDSLDLLYEQMRHQSGHCMTKIFVAGMHEWHYATSRGLISQIALHEGLQQRIERVMRVTIGREMRVINRHMTSLASISVIAPVLGLFGMAWILLHSWLQIAQMTTINLTILAPDIMKALFIFAFGLFSGLSALIGSKHCGHSITVYVERLDYFVVEFMVLLSRFLADQQKND